GCPQQLGVFLDVGAEQRLAAAKAARGESLAKIASLTGIGLGGVDSTKRQLAGSLIQQNHGAAPGTQGGDNVLQVAAQLFVERTDPVEVLAGPQQAQELLARPRASRDVHRQQVGGLFEGLLRGRLDRKSVV